MVTKTSHLPIRYYLVLLWAHPILHISTIRVKNKRVNVKWSRYRPGVAQRVGRDIALPFHDRSTRRGEWSAARPGRTLPPGKTRYPFYRRLGGPQGWSGRAENLFPTGIRSRTVQLVISRYTDWATRPTIYIYINLIFSLKYRCWCFGVRVLNSLRSLYFSLCTVSPTINWTLTCCRYQTRIKHVQLFDVWTLSAIMLDIMNCPPHKKVGGVEVLLHSFLISVLVGGKWSNSRLRRFTTTTTPPFYEIEPHYSLNRKMGRPPQLESEQFGEERNLSFL